MFNNKKQDYEDFDVAFIEDYKVEKAIDRMNNDINELLENKGYVLLSELRSVIGGRDDVSIDCQDMVVLSTERYKKAVRAAERASFEAYNKTFKETWDNYEEGKL